MATIDQLSSTYTLDSGDQLPVYVAANGDARKASINTLLTYVQTNLGIPDIQVFDSVADMKVAPLEVGTYVITKGYYAAGDGGHCAYEVVANNTGTVDNGEFIFLTNASLQARAYFIDNTVTVEQYGAFGDGATDDTTYIQAALNSGRDVYFTSSHYRITAPLTVNSQRVIGGVGIKGSPKRSQSQINIAGNHACFVNGVGGSGDVSFEIDGFRIVFGDTLPTDAATNSQKIGFYFTNNILWPSFIKVSNCTVKGAWWGLYDNTGTYMSKFERVFAWLCQGGFYKQNGTTILFDTCFAQGGDSKGTSNGKWGFYIKDTVSPTLLNCAADKLSVTQANEIGGAQQYCGNYFEGIRSLTINGFDAESNNVSGNLCSFMRIRLSSAHISGFTGYQNDINCGSGEEVYLIKVDQTSTANFSGCRPARNAGSDLTFLGTSGGSPHMLLSYDSSDVEISGSYFSAPTGGSPAAAFSVNAQLNSTAHRSGSKIGGTNVNVKGRYENGTWTPTIAGSPTVVGTPVYSGWYVRNDDVVNVWIKVDLTASDTLAVGAVGTVFFSNWPNNLVPTQRTTMTASDQAGNDMGVGMVRPDIGAYLPVFTTKNIDVYFQYTYYIG